jgi:DNA-binding response OmpR family regulator
MPTFKILIIDYEPRGIKQLNDPLAGAGYQVCLAKDGVSGIAAFQQERPDLVLIEAMIPKKHGFEVCLEIKRTPHGKKTPVVIVTSVYKGRKYRTQALHQYQCDEYLEKPIAPQELLDVVARLLSGRQSAPAPGARPSETATAAPKVASPARAPQSPSLAPTDPMEAEIVDRLNKILGEPEGGGSGSG